MLHYYVYYRVAPERVNEAREAAHQVQAIMATELGVTGRLLRKRGEPLLWMEVYENVPAARPFETRLANACAAARIAEHLEGARHVECFSD